MTHADDWQPITTAPRDGTKIEVWLKDCPVAVYWKKGESPYPWKSVIGDFTWRYDAFKHWRHIRGPEGE